MKKLQTTGLEEWVRKSVTDGAWLLGICLGMQLLMERGEEFGVTAGLGLIEGKVEQIPSVSQEGQSLKLPHIGWSCVSPSPRVFVKEALWEGIDPREHCYFVHSFVVKPIDPAAVLGSCHYGGHTLPAVIGKSRVMGCQFHPEKSGPAGLRFVGNFLRSAGCQPSTARSA
jgi:glutamine amidotransferase